MFYKSKTFELLELLDIVGFIVGIVYGPKWPFYSCCDYIGLFGTGFIQVLYLGRAPRTKETLLDFHEKCRVTRHSRVFRGLTSSQQTPGIRGVTSLLINRQGQEIHEGCLSINFLVSKSRISPRNNP